MQNLNEHININNSDTVDYWQASIASAYDYSPFGVMLTGRTFEGKQTICEDSTTLITQKPLEEGFNSWGSWTAMGNGLVTYVSGEMQVSNPNTSKKDIGASKAFTTGTGLHNVSFEVIGNTCATVVIWPPSSTPIPIKVSVKDNYGNVVASGDYTTAGTYNLSFTPASASATYTLEFNMTKASAFCFFRVDDVVVSYDDTTTVTVCKEVEDGYRYGFQGQEKDDQVSGKGNSYTAEFWQYSPRLGRRWNIDPVIKEYESPYAAFENNSIWFIDYDGKDGIKFWDNSSKKKTLVIKADYHYIKGEFDEDILIKVKNEFSSYRKIYYNGEKIRVRFEIGFQAHEEGSDLSSFNGANGQNRLLKVAISDEDVLELSNYQEVTSDVNKMNSGAVYVAEIDQDVYLNPKAILDRLIVAISHGIGHNIGMIHDDEDMMNDVKIKVYKEKDLLDENKTIYRPDFTPNHVTKNNVQKLINRIDGMSKMGRDFWKGKKGKKGEDLKDTGIIK